MGGVIVLFNVQYINQMHHIFITRYTNYIAFSFFQPAKNLLNNKSKQSNNYYYLLKYTAVNT